MSKRETLPTGSQRDSRAGKGRFDLISPFALRRIAFVYEEGVALYGDRNWEKGQPLHYYLESAIRHLNDFMAGDFKKEDHLARACWNLMSLMHTQTEIETGNLPKRLDDLPPRMEWKGSHALKASKKEKTSSASSAQKSAPTANHSSILPKRRGDGT